MEGGLRFSGGDLKIIVNTIPTLAPLTGVGQYTYQMARELRRLAPEEEWYSYYGFVSRKLAGEEEALGASLFTMGKLLRSNRVTKAASRFFQRQAARLQPGQFDLYFEPNFIPLPEIRSRRCMVTVHDLSFFLYPQWHPKDRVAYFQHHFSNNIARADIVLADSNYILNEACTRLGIPREKLRMIYAGCDHRLFSPQGKEAVARVRSKYNISGPYFLYVGTIEPRKNLQALARVFGRFASGRKRPPQLVLCGYQGWSNTEIMGEFESLAQREMLRFLGYVPAKDLPGLYSGAVSLVYPSLYEGFGLPVVEAMASGCPVLCSDRASLPEAAGDAALFVDPENDEEILGGLRRIEGDAGLRASMREKGLRQSGRFSWERSAAEILALMRELAEAEGQAP